MRLVYLPFILGTLLLSACSNNDDVKTVSFKNDVMPIFLANCTDCHNAGDAKGTEMSGLRLDSYAGIMSGTKFGPVVDPGYPASSVLNQVIEGRVDKSISMPHGKESLNKSEQALVRAWVEQGALDN